MKSTKVAVLSVAAAAMAACSGDPVRHTPDATPADAAVDASPDAYVSPAMLSGTPADTDFGDVVVGQPSSSVSYTISNDGDETSGTLGVIVDPTASGFAVSDNTCSGITLAKHATCTFAIAFTPGAAGISMATVHIAATPGGELTRNVMGNGLQPGALDIVQASHAFNPRLIDGTPTTATFTVKNTGQVATGTPMPSITGTAGAYAIASTTCNAPLAPNATCSVGVTFHPTTVGSKPATLVVTGSPGGSDSATLSGTGIAHVTVTKTGNGTVTSNMTGIDCGSGCATDFSATPVTLTAAPDMGANFTGWMGDCSGSTTTCTLDLTASKNVVAAFAPQRFTLTTSTTGTGMGTVSGAGMYDYGTPVTVTASAATGSTFTGWGGDCAGMPTCTVTMTANHAVSANFDANPETLTVSASGGGTVVSTPAGISCSGATCTHDFDYNQMVRLDAVPDAGHQLSAVGGDCTTLPCTVTMDQARSVRVGFSAITYKFNLSLLGDIQGNVTVTTPGGTTVYSASTTFGVTYGDQIRLTAMAGNADILFAGWGGACSSYGQTLTCYVDITGDTSASATWLHTSYTYTVTATTVTANGLPFDVTYLAATNQSAECQSSQSPGTTCPGTLKTLTRVDLVAHLPPPDFAPYRWNTLPRWSNCDSVSADGFTCTFTLNGRRAIQVYGDTTH